MLHTVYLIQLLYIIYNNTYIIIYISLYIMLPTVYLILLLYIKHILLYTLYYCIYIIILYITQSI